MRTENEKLMIPIAEDLIDIVSLSKTYAARVRMKLDEACHFVTGAIVNCDELIEVYRTDQPGLPVCIGEVNSKVDFRHVLEALWMPFKSCWWEDHARLSAIQFGWGGTVASVAIRKDDAVRLLGVNLSTLEIPQESSGDTSLEPDPLDLPEELDAANMAFRAVTNNYGDQSETFKNRLIDYLRKTFPDFSNSAVERIATVANPDKSPGRK